MFRVIAREDNRFGVQGETLAVEDVTTQESEIKTLLNLLNRERVSEVHLMDVIQDWFGAETYRALKI